MIADQPGALPGELRILCEIVRRAAQEEITPRFCAVVREFKADGSTVTAADHAMQARLERDLRHQWPEIPLFGEEMDSATQAALLEGHHAGVWCLDPLDGTTNFAAGIPLFGVSIALIRKDAPAMGVIYDPIREECYAAAAGQGAWCNGVRLYPQKAPDFADCVAAIDFKRLTPNMAQQLVAHPPYGSQRNFGSSVIEWAWVARERVHLYLHGAQAMWDYAAGLLLLTEAGGIARTLSGEAVFHPSLAPRSVIAALDAEQFRIWQNHLTQLT